MVLYLGTFRIEYLGIFPPQAYRRAVGVACRTSVSQTHMGG